MVEEDSEEANPEEADTDGYTIITQLSHTQSAAQG